jgi:hypothetical protein
VAPNFPYLHYYIVKSRVTISNADVNTENHKTLIGDIAYLSAILARSADKNQENTKETPPPESNNNISQLVYLIPSSIEFTEPAKLICGYSNFVNYHFLNVYLKIPLPPPELLS